MTDLMLPLPVILPANIIQFLATFHTGNPQLIMNIYKAFAVSSVDDTDILHNYKLQVQQFIAQIAYQSLKLIPEGHYFDEITDSELMCVYDTMFNAGPFTCDGGGNLVHEFTDCVNLIDDLDENLPFSVDNINIRHIKRIQLLEKALLTKSQALLDCVKFNFYQYWMALYLYFKHNHQVHGPADASASLTNDTGLFDLLMEFSHESTLVQLLKCATQGLYLTREITATSNIVNPNLALTKRIIAANQDINMHGLTPYQYWNNDLSDNRSSLSLLLLYNTNGIDEGVFKARGITVHEYWTIDNKHVVVSDKRDSRLLNYLKQDAAVGAYLKML